MVKVRCNNDDLEFEVLVGRPLEIVAELQQITIEAIRLMTEDQPDSIKKMMLICTLKH